MSVWQIHTVSFRPAEKTAYTGWGKTSAFSCYRIRQAKYWDSVFDRRIVRVANTKCNSGPEHFTCTHESACVRMFATKSHTQPSNKVGIGTELDLTFGHLCRAVTHTWNAIARRRNSHSHSCCARHIWSILYPSCKYIWEKKAFSDLRVIISAFQLSRNMHIEISWASLLATLKRCRPQTAIDQANVLEEVRCQGVYTIPTCAGEV